MSKKESLARYSLIIKKLRKTRATWSQIQNYLEIESEVQGYNFNISNRTFQRDREEIFSLYKIDIQFDFSNKVYYLEEAEQQDAYERILEAFDVFNALNISDRLSEHIHFESRKPLGTAHLYGILHAIMNRLQFKFSYHKYWDNTNTMRTVAPYALKEFKNRWYVLAKDFGDEKVKSFALDRIADLEISKKEFSFPIDFDVQEYYKYCFGIIVPTNAQAQNVILSFDAHQGNYIKSLPLHPSQKILIDNEEELRISLKLYLTHDFFMELLSYGENLKVLQPKSLISKMKSTLKQMLEMYED